MTTREKMVAIVTKAMTVMSREEVMEMITTMSIMSDDAVRSIVASSSIDTDA